jgi:hypothetical protein
LAEENDKPSTSDDDEERKVLDLAEGMHEGLEDPLTRHHMSQLASAAMGDAGADDSGDEPPPRGPGEKV